MESPNRDDAYRDWPQLNVESITESMRGFIEVMQKIGVIADEVNASISRIPQPSKTPPMWAVNPQKSKRNPRSTRRVK